MFVLTSTLAGYGLRPRGWVFCGTGAVHEERDFQLESGEPVSAICLIGHAGSELWPMFEAWHRQHSGIADPLDSWSKATINPIAAAVGGEAVFPSDKPWHPFQQWAMVAEGLKPSPLGLLIHPDYGLWHGYRGAILFGERARSGLSIPDCGKPGDASDSAAFHPCDTCIDKPCLSACPVEAFTPAGFAAADCRCYLKSEAGRNGCMHSGCLARDACPVGREYRYNAEQIRFHMAAFG